MERTMWPRKPTISPGQWRPRESMISHASPTVQKGPSDSTSWPTTCTTRPRQRSADEVSSWEKYAERICEVIQRVSGARLGVGEFDVDEFGVGGFGVEAEAGAEAGEELGAAPGLSASRSSNPVSISLSCDSSPTSVEPSEVSMRHSPAAMAGSSCTSGAGTPSTWQAK